MLNNVPESINRMTRNIVINHPNGFNAVMLRKRVTRTNAENGENEEIGGLPTLGGLAVISNEDEEAVEWDLLGNAYALEAAQFSPALMMDRQDAHNGTEDETRFLIEPETPAGEEGAYTIQKNDVMYLSISEHVLLAFEIVGIESPTNIPPYTQRYICNRQADLHVTL